MSEKPGLHIDEYDLIAKEVMAAVDSRVSEIENAPFFLDQPRWKDSGEPRLILPFVQLPKDGDIRGSYSPIESPTPNRSTYEIIKEDLAETKERLRLAARQTFMVPDGESGVQQMLATPYGVAEELRHGLDATKYAFGSIVDQSSDVPRKALAASVAASVLIAGGSVITDNNNGSEQALGSDGTIDTELIVKRTDYKATVTFDSANQDIALSEKAAEDLLGVQAPDVVITGGKIEFSGEATNASNGKLIAATMEAERVDVVPAEITPEPKIQEQNLDIEIAAATEKVRALENTIVSEAKKYYGITEDPNTPNHSPEIDEYFQMGLEGPRAEWCASYVSRVLKDAGVPFSGGDKDGHKGPEWQIEFVNNVYLWAKENKAQIFDSGAIEGGFKPKAGDLVIYNADGNLGDGRSGVNHIGIVEGYDPITGLVSTIEGNLKNSVSSRKFIPAEKINETDGKQLAGFIRLADLIEPAELAALANNQNIESTNTEVINDPAGNYIKVMEQLLSEIASHEGSWDDINTGKAGDTPFGSDEYYNVLGGRKLTELTIKEIIELQRSGDLFAVGRYQMIAGKWKDGEWLPGTFESSVSSTGIDVNKLFTPDVQNELAVNYLIFTKRENLAAYIKGESDNLRLAIDDLCMEWASNPCSNELNEMRGMLIGSGYYDGDSAGNNAVGGEEKLKRYALILMNLKEAYKIKDQPSGDENSSQEQIKLVAIGDSLLVGARDAGIEEMDTDFGVNIVGLDARVGRALSRGEDNGMDSIERLIANGVISEETTTVYFGLGTNSENPEPFEKNLRETIARIGEVSDAQVILPLVFSKVPHRQAMNNAISKVGKETGSKVIEIGKGSELAGDDVHLKNYGNLATEILEVASETGIKPEQTNPAPSPQSSALSEPVDSPEIIPGSETPQDSASLSATTQVEQPQKTNDSLENTGKNGDEDEDTKIWVGQESLQSIYSTWIGSETEVDGKKITIDQDYLNEWMAKNVPSKERNGQTIYEIDFNIVPTETAGAN